MGKPTVKPSTERPTTCWASARTPARSSRRWRGTPCHTALPTSRPPTSFDTHDRVTASVTMGSASSSSNDRVNGSSTRPSTDSDHEAGSTWGTTRAVSMR